MLRWTNFNMLAHYAHGFKSDKLEAQGAVLDRLVKSGMKSGVSRARGLYRTLKLKLWMIADPMSRFLTLATF